MPIFRTTNQNVRLKAVAQIGQNVGGGEQVTFSANEEGLTAKNIVVAALGGALIQRTNHRTNGISDRSVRGGSIRAAIRS